MNHQPDNQETRERLTARLQGKVQARLERLRTKSRRAGLISLGLAGLAYDRAKTYKDRTGVWLDTAARRGELVEENLEGLRARLRGRAESIGETLQEKGERLEARLKSQSTGGDSAEGSDIPVEEQTPPESGTFDENSPDDAASATA